MIVYSIQKSKYHDWPIQGALFAEGRWNKPGQWIIYTSSTISLAKLEILANSKIVPRNMAVYKIRISDNAPIHYVEQNHLPENWMKVQYQEQLHEITDFFLKKSTELLMRIPSAQSMTEYNYLINPRHPKFEKWVRLIGIFDEVFDERLK